MINCTIYKNLRKVNKQFLSCMNVTLAVKDLIINNHIMKGRRSRTIYVAMYVCMYPSSAHSFDPIVMKLGMDTPWDAGVS